MPIGDVYLQTLAADEATTMDISQISQLYNLQADGYLSASHLEERLSHCRVLEYALRNQLSRSTTGN